MKVLFFYVFGLSILCFGSVVAQNNTYTLSVKVTNGTTGEPLSNADIFLDPCQCGGISDEQGMFKKKLPENTYKATISFIGFDTMLKTIRLDKDVTLNILLYEKEEQLSEVVVRAKTINENITSPQMGAVQVTAAELKKIPAALGEVDVLRGITLLPGVNNAGDVSNGLSVRGGTLDQNLLLYDYAPVYNPTHLFGLFSVFTPDIVSNVDLYRANIPARYGGRTTSILDIKAKNPYIDKFKLSGGIGLISSRLNIETPLLKDKLMVTFGARAGFTDFLLPVFSERLKDTKAKFYDGTLKLLYLPTEKDQVVFTGFYTKDFYQLDLISRIENINAENNQYDFRTLNGTVNWLHTFDEKTSLRNILVSSNYTAKNIFPEVDSANEVLYDSNIHYTGLISEFSKQAKDSFDYYAGLQANRYKIDPGTLDPGNSNSVLPIALDSEVSYELSAYANVNWQPFDFLKLSGGLRYTYFLFQGPFTLNTYDEVSGDILSTEFFEKGEKVDTYDGLEPRLGASLQLNENMSVKFSYARMNQYLQNIYNSTTPLPTSRWKTADPNILPQRSDAFGVGMYRNFGKSNVEIGLEGYYRRTVNNLTYKPGADFFLERFIERDVVQGPGRAYGLEFSLNKTAGPVNGRLNYTWSRSFLRTETQNLREQINNNEWFNSDFDRPHVLNMTLNIETDPYNTFSFNFTGQSGRPFTAANGVIELSNDIDVPIFLERNNARLPTYHRLDFSWNVHFSKSKKNKRWMNDWTFTIYNLYGRKNPLNIYYTQINNAEESRLFLGNPLGSFELTVLNAPLFSLTYNFTFQ